MNLEMKALLVTAAVCLVAMGYALTQGDWGGVAMLAFIEVLAVLNFRTEKRNRSLEIRGHRNEA